LSAIPDGNPTSPARDALKRGHDEHSGQQKPPKKLTMAGLVALSGYCAAVALIEAKDALADDSILATVLLVKVVGKRRVPGSPEESLRRAPDSRSRFPCISSAPFEDLYSRQGPG
jgi:hypothetical protein